MWHLPYIRVIAAHSPTGQVVLITRPTTRADRLLAAEPSVADVIYTPFARGTWNRLRETWELGRILRGRRFQSVWVLDKISRPAMSAALAGVPDRRGFGFRAQCRWLSDRRTLPLSLEKAHQLDKLAAFLEVMGLPPADLGLPLRIASADAVGIEQRFGHLPRPWVLLGTDSAVPERVWPAEYFSALLGGLAEAGVPTIFLQAGRDQQSRIQTINGGAAPASGIDVSGLDMAEMAALLASADLFIGNDSGPMNVAVAVGTPAVSLSGGLPPLAPRPFYHPILPPSGNSGGMASIHPEEVLARSLALVSPASGRQVNLAHDETLPAWHGSGR